VSRRATLYPWDMTWSNRRLLPHSVEVVNCDLTQESEVASLMLRLKPDVVFHLAADPLVKNWGPSVTRDATLSTHHLLTYAPAGCRFVLASSATVYGDPPRVGKRRRSSTRCGPRRPTGRRRRPPSMLVTGVHARPAGSNGLSLRLAATVGAGATHGLVPDLVRKALSDSPALDLLGESPGSVKPFTHVSDVVDGFVELGLYRHRDRAPVNLALVERTECGLDAARAAWRPSGSRSRSSWVGRRANWKGDNPRRPGRLPGGPPLTAGTRSTTTCWSAVAQAALELDPRVTSETTKESA
jgi:nucleoside-diphosphate-sugar epimerase